MTNNSNKYFWACDHSSKSGEGRLARMFIDYRRKQTGYNFIRIHSSKNYIFRHKYISPFIGIFYCWLYYLKKKEIYYINFLPLWNFMLFAFLPPHTKFGPITGGANYSNNNLNFIRKFIFPIFYKISEFFINIRGHYIFSTDLLKKYLSRKTVHKSKFNYIFNFINIDKKKVKKEIDFLIYFRKHNNKKSLFPIETIKKLILYGFDVRIIGDNLNLPKIKNYGYISNSKVKSLLKKTHFTLPSEENIYSIFILECIENNVKILITKNIYKNIKYFKKSFIKIELKKIRNLKKITKDKI